MSVSGGLKGLATGAVAEIAGQSAGDHQIAIALIGAAATAVTVLGGPIALDLYKRARGTSTPAEDHTDLANTLLERLEDRDREVTDLRRELAAVRRDLERERRDHP